LSVRRSSTGAHAQPKTFAPLAEQALALYVGLVYFAASGGLSPA
jgi:hypothetical protein